MKIHGLSDADIARELHYSVQSINVKKRVLIGVLGALSVPHAVAIALHKGIITFEDIL